jgi:hypothetical protein
MRHLTAVLSGLLPLVSYALFAAEPASTPAAKPSAALPEPTKETPAGAKAADATDTTPSTAGDTAKKAASPQRFIPSEQVRADFDVSFPVDI